MIHLKKMCVATLVLVAVLLGGCAKPNLSAPCPNFGASCHQTPINSWSSKN